MIRVGQLVYDCIPNAGSDPGIGWHAVVSASRAGMAVHAITKASNRPAIEAVEAPPNVTFHYVDVAEKTGPISTGSSVGDTIHLSRWLRKAKAIALDLADRDQIDLTHFVTFSAFWMPVPFADVPVPHVFGPVGGGERIDPALACSPRDKISAAVRNALQTSFTRVPTWRSLLTAQDTVVITGGRATTSRLEALGIDVFETGATGCLTEALIAELDSIIPIHEPGTTLVCSGRQLRWKGHDLAISAMPVVLSDYPDARLEFLGAGPVHDDLRAQAEELEIADRVIFRSDIGRDEERRRIAGADCFVFPSRRDTGSTLVPLVQVLGVPIAAFDTGALPDSTGGFAYLGEPTCRPTARTGLSEAIVRALDAGPEQLEAARAHAIERHGESTSIESISRWYHQALER